MSIAPPRSTAATHDVVNQAPPLVGYNAFEANRPLVEALQREGAEWARDRVAAFGVLRGDPEVQAWARQANENPPQLRTHDRYGHRIDEVEFHPAWHELLGRCVEAGVHALPWREPQPAAHVARGALMYVLPEAGVGCPIYNICGSCAGWFGSSSLPASSSWPPHAHPASRSRRRP